MHIQSIRYADAARAVLIVTTPEGEVFVPWPCATWRAEPIAAWLAAGGAIADPPAPTLAAVKAEAEAAIRRQSAAARDAWRTPGKDAVYLRKLDEASRWEAAGSPAELAAFPHIAAEAGITAPSAAELVALWRSLDAAWGAASAQIEAVEQGALKALAAATDEAAAQACAAGLAWPQPPAA